jgi:hypothetical protein
LYRPATESRPTLTAKAEVSLTVRTQPAAMITTPARTAKIGFFITATINR